MRNILVLFFIFLSFPLFCAESANFPYKAEVEDFPKKWMGVRVEGQGSSYLKNPFRFIHYTIKAFNKKFTATSEIKNYFEYGKSIFEKIHEKDKFENSVLKMELAGDIMWLRSGWKNFMDKRLLDHMKGQDLLFANLETLISKSHKVPTFPPARATFNSPPSLVDEFKRENGKSLFSALSVANNHSLDYGEKGFYETLDVLDQRKIPWSGALLNSNKEKRWVEVSKNGVRVGFYAATYGMNNRWEEGTEINFNLLRDFAPHDLSKEVDLNELRSVLGEMESSGIDIKIISLHWGFEYEYYPEARQMVVARDIVSAGADIIMGHHSHSQQPLDICFVGGLEKKYDLKKSDKTCTLKGPRPRKALIIYSLGNFLTNMYGFLSEIGSLADVEFFKREDGHFDWKAPKIHLIYNERVVPDAGKDKRNTSFLQDYMALKRVKRDSSYEDKLEEIEFLESLYSDKVLQY